MLVSIFIGVFAILAGACVYLFRRSTPTRGQKPARPPADPAPRSAANAAFNAKAPTLPVPRRPRLPIPQALRDFRFVRSSELEPEKVRALTARLRTIPRPPGALHRLTSTDFLATATPAELSEMVMNEPEVAVKVLAIANSPLYGLQQLVGDITEAVKFLGMNTVRGICLQHLLNRSFQAASPEMKKVYERLWNESALACELCFKLAQLLKLDEPGTFVTQVVLSCLGRQATYSLMDPSDALSMASKGLLERSQLEQQRLGLASAEIGGLLMQEWGLPKNIIHVVQEIDATLVSPVSGTSTSRRTRSALCYLCARLAEGLASGDIADLGTFDISDQEAIEYFHLHAYLELPTLAQTPEFIRSPAVSASLRRMAETMQVQR